MHVGGGVSRAVLDALVAFSQIARDADGGFAGGAGEGGGYRGFVAGDQALVGVGAGVGEGQHGARQAVFQQPTQVGEGGGREPVDAVTREDAVPALFQVLVHVQPVAGQAVQGFGHEGGVQPVIPDDVADDPLGQRDLVGCLRER